MKFILNFKVNILFWLAFILAVVSVQAQLITNSKESLNQNEVLNISSYQQQWATHTKEVTCLVTKVQSELKSYNNIRLSTEYTMTDLIFFLKQYLPSWVYPPSVWKQDSITRRRNIARIVRSSRLASRPRYVKLRDEVVEWTKDCNAMFYNQYAVESIEGLESLIDAMMDFVTITTDKELMNPEFVTAGFATLNKAIHNYIEGNNKKFNLMIKEANDEFNSIVTLGGELRLPLESIREDAMSQTIHIRNELFDQVIYGLHHLVYTIETNIKTLSHELMDADETTSEALRKHTADTIHSELLYFDNIQIVTIKLKTLIDKVWKNATNELAQSPLTSSYWVDVSTEVKDALAELARIVAMTLKTLLKNPNCQCRLRNFR